MKQSVVIFGSSGHAKVVADLVLSRDDLILRGFISDPLAQMSDLVYRGCSVVGSDLDLESLRTEYGSISGVIGIGNGAVRKKVVREVRARFPWFQFLSVVHHSSSVSPSVQIGEGCIIMPGVVLNAEVIVREHSLINTGCTVDHETAIGSYVSLAPGVTVGGGVTIGNEVVIGMGATIFQSVKISEGSLVGGGSLVIKSLDRAAVYYGSPASKIREIDEPRSEIDKN